MKAALSLALLAAVAASAQADDKKADDKKAPDLNASPWSVTTDNKSDGYFGSSSTSITRDLGEGWSVGGKVTTPYQDRKIGGSGTPGLKQYESPSDTTVFGPVLEKKF